MISGPSAGETFEVRGEVVIGREDVDIELSDAEVSPRHVAVRPLGRGLEIEDLGSSTGTFLNGKRIDAPTPVGGGAEIRLGATVLRVEGVLRADALVLPVDELEATIIPDAARNATVVNRRSPVSPEPAASAPTLAVRDAPAARPAATPPPTQPVGAFNPPGQEHRGGLASRSWIPVALSFGTVILVAAALVVYFATR